MLRDHEGDVRQCYLIKGFPLGDQVEFGLYSPEGGTSGEMSIRWQNLSARPTPYLHAYDDAWSTLAMFADVIAALAVYDNEYITPEKVIEILVGCGFTDATNEEN